MPARFARAAVLVAAVGLATTTAGAQLDHPPLASRDIDDLATLVKLEDTRTFDGVALERILQSRHPEVRRRAIISIGRIVKDGAQALLARVRNETNVQLVSTAAFAAGQLKDPAAVTWLDDWLNSALAFGAAPEAARSLGKIRTPDARAALARFLASGSTATSAYHANVGEALLAIGRFPDKGDIQPIVRWLKSPNVGIRWRATWALFRPRDPAAVPYLLTLVDDRAAEVRFWAVRGLAPALVDQAGLDRATVSARLRKAVHDKDRRVRTEALRALLQFDDDGAFAELLAALESRDTWLSTSAAEAALRFQSRAARLTPRLMAAAAPDKPLWLRNTVLTALITLAPDTALEVATSLAHDAAAVARTSAVQALGRLGEAGRARLGELNADPRLEGLLPAGRGGRSGGAGGGGASGGAGGGGGPARPPAAVRTDAEYRQIVERWIVPEYNGKPRPHAIWETARGRIELELFAGDAPLGMEYFVKAVTSGDIVGTEFGRVLPNFVDQQQAVRNAPTLRDEVNAHGLNRGTLAWASSGLDTGRPGYTLGITPQPHNEGDFTALGRVVKGMDVVDKLEWGDKILSAKMKK